MCRDALISAYNSLVQTYYGKASQILFIRFCPRETSYRRLSEDLTYPPPSLRNVTHFFFDFAEAPAALFTLQSLRLSVLYKSVKVHLGQSQELIMSIHIYLKYKYTYENAGFLYTLYR